MGTFIISTSICRNTPVLQFVVCLFTWWKKHIVGIVDLFLNIKVVCTVVGDVKFAVAVNQCQVTIAIQTSGVTSTNGDEVAVIDIVNGGSGVAEHSLGVGIHSVTTVCNVTTCEYSIVDDDTTLYEITVNNRTCIYIVPFHRPTCIFFFLLRQGIQI